MSTDTQQQSLAKKVIDAANSKLAFTCLIVHEDKPIFVRSARGTIPLHHLMPEVDNKPIARNEIVSYYSEFAAHSNDRAAMTEHWEKETLPKLDTVGRATLAIPIPGGMNLRFEVLYHDKRKIGLIIRVAGETKPDLDPAFPIDLAKALEDGRKGIVLITGPIAAGKTQTAHTTIQHLSRSMTGHVITIEEPIERSIDGGDCVVTQREVGRDVPDFASGLEQALGQSPDIIMIGEIRDKKTAETAIIAGESGALVIVTTHSLTISGALRKILFMAGEHNSRALSSVFAGSLIAVVRQQLVKLGNRYQLVCDYIDGDNAAFKQLLTNEDWDGIDRLLENTGSTSNISMNTALGKLVRTNELTKSQAVREASHPRVLARML